MELKDILWLQKAVILCNGNRCKFNMGVGTKEVVLQKTGCEPTVKMLTALRREDDLRVNFSEIKIQTKTRIMRQKQRRQRNQKLKTNQQHVYLDALGYLQNQNSYQKTQIKYGMFS